MNANSLFNKRSSFDTILHEFNSKEQSIIFVVNDTRLNNTIKLHFNGYEMICFNGNNGKRIAGGSCFIFSKNLHAVKVHSIGFDDLGIVDFTINGRKIRVATIYLRPGKEFKEPPLLIFFTTPQRKKKWVKYI